MHLTHSSIRRPKEMRHVPGFCRICLYTFCAIATFALAQNDRSSKIEVLYLAETQADQHVLLTNVQRVVCSD